MLEISTLLLPLQANGGNGGSAILLLFYLAIIVVVIAGMWKAFEKAGKPGWAVLIPIYNVYVLIKISGNEWWYLLLLLVPIISFFVLAKISIDVAKAFGQGLGFGIGLWLLGFIFWPLLGFGDYEYRRSPGAAQSA